MRQKMNSCGKTWHSRDTAHGDELPLGSPKLARSFDRLGEADPSPSSIAIGNSGSATEAKRAARQDLLPLARAQSGVDALAGRFNRPTRPILGVDEAASAQ